VKSSERILAVGLALVLGLAAAPPDGLRGDLLRGALVLALGVLAILQGALGANRPRLGWGALLFAPPLAVAALQLLPWPSGLLESLNPGLAGLYRAEEAAGGLPAAGRPATPHLVQSARYLLLGLAYLTAFALARGRRQRRALTASAVAVTTIVAGWSLAALYLSPSVHWARRASGPFVNPNHLCAFLLLGLCLSLGLIGSRLPRTQRLLAAGCALLQLVTIVGTRSRAGIVAALLGAGLTLLILGSGTRRRAVGAALGLLVLVGGLTFSDSEALRGRFQNAGQEASFGLGARTETWALASGRIRAAPLLGEGLGSFDLQSQARLDAERLRWTRPGAAHNDYLELAGDVGVPALGLAVVGLMILLAQGWRSTRRARGTSRGLQAGALGGLVGLLAHSAVDFPLHQPGIALLATLALAIALGRGRHRHGPRRPLRAAIVAWGLLLVATGALVAWRGAGEEGARAAYAKIRGVRAALRGEQTRRVLPTLEAGVGFGASAKAAAFLGSALETRSVYLLGESELESSGEVHTRALEQLRTAVAKSPGDARFQLQLAAALLRSQPTPERQQEVARRLQIALERAPTQPTILFGGAEVALELRVRTGDEAHLALAERCLRRGLLQRPDEARRARAIAKRYGAKLGRRADVLLGRIAEFEEAAKANAQTREPGS
jgi:O-antigen ligase